MRPRLEGGFGDQFVPYGIPTEFIYKGMRPDSDATWYDYEIAFGPGVMLQFAVRVDATGKVNSMSFA